MDIPSPKDWFDSTFGPADDSVGDTSIGPDEICEPAKRAIRPAMGQHFTKREPVNGFASANGVTPLDGRLLNGQALISPNLASALKGAMFMITYGQLQGNLVPGGKIFTHDGSASSYLLGGRPMLTWSDWESKTPSLTHSAQNPDYKQVFWSTAYTYLSTIKTKYDPTTPFQVTSRINADHQQVIDGCIRDALDTSLSSNLAPVIDFLNLPNHTDDTDTNKPEFPVLAPRILSEEQRTEKH
ncbi:MAG: hypothetical protein Q9165_008166 [Trypethelium subeluteriae]